MDAGDPDALNEATLGIDLNFDGDTLDIVTFDGRGFARSVDLPGIGSTVPDIGAFEVQTTPTAGPDIIIGTANFDLLRLEDGGSDSVSALGDNDALFFGDAFDDGDVVDAGAGDDDQIAVQGDYSGGLTFGANSVDGVEQIVLLPGSNTSFGAPGTEFYDYDLTLVDANIGAGEFLIFQANQLRAGEDFTLDASAETDGSIFTFAGLGNESITGGDLTDAFFFGTDRFNPGDRLDGGGGGQDAVGLQGDYAAQLAIGPNQLVNIDQIAFLSSTDPRFGADSTNAFSYNIVMDDGNVAAGQSMTLIANTLTTAETLTFDGSAETDGSFQVFSGNAGDTISGSQGGDTIFGRGGADT
ncbi:MAG: hypothetical protein AAGL98_10795, partial [Planctomycetota bacterium]